MFQQQPNMGFSTLQTDFQDDGANSPSFSPTYIQILESDLVDWSTQGYVLVADDCSQVPNNTTWAVYEYTSLSDESSNGTDDSLNGLSRADAVNRNFSSSHTFSGDSADVVVADSADQLNDIIDVLNGNQPMPGNLDMGGNSINNASNINTEEEIEDIVNTLLQTGDKLSWTYDDANDTLTIDTTALDQEEVEDQVNSLLVGGNNITLTYNDGANTLTIDTSGTGGNLINASESGVVGSGDAGNLSTIGLANDEALKIYKAVFTLSDGQAVPSGCDLIIATLDNTGSGISQSTILSGDGSTVYDKFTGSPLDSYINTSGGDQTVMVAIDNGNWNAGTGSNQNIATSVLGDVE